MDLRVRVGKRLPPRGIPRGPATSTMRKARPNATDSRRFHRFGVGELDHRHSRYEHGERSERKEHPPREAAAGDARAARTERPRRAESNERPLRERPVEKPIAKAVHDGFDFSKPYEPGGSDATNAAKPAAPLRRGTARPVAALLGGLSTPRK